MYFMTYNVGDSDVPFLCKYETETEAFEEYLSKRSYCRNIVIYKGVEMELKLIEREGNNE